MKVPILVEQALAKDIETQEKHNQINKTVNTRGVKNQCLNIFRLLLQPAIIPYKGYY